MNKFIKFGMYFNFVFLLLAAIERFGNENYEKATYYLALYCALMILDKFLLEQDD